MRNPMQRGRAVSNFLALAVLAALVARAGMALPAMAANPAPKGLAEHVVIMVWDGMRPDFITPALTPNLSRLAREGVFFTNHHPVFVSSTEVNGAAIATGLYPRHSRIYANQEYFPEIKSLALLGTEKPETVRRGDELTRGHYLGGPTMAELVQKAGFPTVVAGTKGVALLLDRSPDRTSGAAAQSVDLRTGKTFPADALSTIVKDIGRSFPTNVTYPNVEEDAWTTDALTRSLWKNGVPKLTMVWMSDPDYTQHQHAPGSPRALAALASVDRNLGAVLETLENKGVRDKTDVFVVSDHGFSTISRMVDIASILKTNGFKAASKFEKPAAEQVLVASLGGSVMLYVPGHEAAVIRKLVEFFQASDLAAVIFTRHGGKGALSFAKVKLDANTLLPDVLVALKWSADRNKHGAPGMVVGDGTLKAGQGTHASLSRFDMHNTLVGAGPDLRPGWVDTLPTGNADLAPTVHWILGLPEGVKYDGRVLSEALRSSFNPPPPPRTRILRASKRTNRGEWVEELTVTKIGRAVYFDEGDGGLRP